MINVIIQLKIVYFIYSYINYNSNHICRIPATESDAYRAQGETLAGSLKVAEQLRLKRVGAIISK